MSSENNHKMIKKKQDIQAKYQFALSQANIRVLSWLKPPSSSISSSTGLTKEKQQEEKPDDSIDSFLSLPIMAQGAGLSLAECNEKDNLNTIGDFMKSDLNSMKRTKQRLNNISSTNHVSKMVSASKDDSKAMTSLKNKLRSENRVNVKKQHSETNNNRFNNTGRDTQKNRCDRNSVGNTSTNGDDSDSDEDSKMKRNITAKKGSNLLFDTKSKSKKNRPF